MLARAYYDNGLNFFTSTDKLTDMKPQVQLISLPVFVCLFQSLQLHCINGL